MPRQRVSSLSQSQHPAIDIQDEVVIVVLGASGDLAKKKTVCDCKPSWIVHRYLTIPSAYLCNWFLCSTTNHLIRSIVAVSRAFWSRMFFFFFGFGFCPSSQACYYFCHDYTRITNAPPPGLTVPQRASTQKYQNCRLCPHKDVRWGLQEAYIGLL